MKTSLAKVGGAEVRRIHVHAGAGVCSGFFVFRSAKVQNCKTAKLAGQELTLAELHECMWRPLASYHIQDQRPLSE